ncbi:hypothetical protein L2449_27270 [Mesorhizobium muleiense]|uniref:hypothetical protein n=1 Tax=Mesorhizobium muleiense TaxID=1004279 RepID=UPI001F1E9AA5|nr:hypothetical protein [Mesorhizobium muleiense]MCF6120529.1 hypothetical protein [Mesorhizobium muleiense]
MPNEPDQGHQAAHTPADASAQAPAEALPGADPLDLLAGSPDIDAQDVLALAAEPVLSRRRARGRPEGAANRKNGDMIRYLAAHGHRDPWVTLSLIQSADTLKLAQAMRTPVMKNGKQVVSKAGTPLFNTPNPMDVLAMQVRAADALLPYHHAKKPLQLELPAGDKRPMMVFGNVEHMQVIADGDGFMSAGVMPGEKPNEINGDAVRLDGDQPHDKAKPLISNDIDGSND